MIQQTNAQPPGYNETQQQSQQHQQQSQLQSRRSIIRQIFNLPSFNSSRKKHRKQSAAESATSERITNSIQIQNSITNNNNQKKVFMQQDDITTNRNLPSFESQRQQKYLEFTDYQLPQQQHQKPLQLQQQYQQYQQQQVTQLNPTSGVPSMQQQELIFYSNKVPVQQQQSHSEMVLEQSAVIKESLVGDQFLMNGDSLDIQLQALLGSQLFHNHSNLQYRIDNETQQQQSLSQTIQLEQTKDYALDCQDIFRHKDRIQLIKPPKMQMLHQQPFTKEIGQGFKENNNNNNNNNLGDNRRVVVNTINNNSLIPPSIISSSQGYPTSSDSLNPNRNRLQTKESNKQSKEFNQIAANNCLFHPQTDSQSKNNHKLNLNGIISLPANNLANLSCYDQNLNSQSKHRLNSENDLIAQYNQEINLEQSKKDSEQLQLAFKRNNSENNHTNNNNSTAEGSEKYPIRSCFHPQFQLLNSRTNDNQSNQPPLHTILSSNNFNIQSSNPSEHYEWSEQILRDNKITSIARVKRPKKRPVSSQFNPQYVSVCLPGEFPSIDNNNNMEHHNENYKNNHNSNDEFFSLLNAGGQQQFLKVEEDLLLLPFQQQQVGQIARSSERLAHKRNNNRLHSQASSQSTSSLNSRLDQQNNQIVMNDQVLPGMSSLQEKEQQLQQNQINQPSPSSQPQSANLFSKRSQSMPELIEVATTVSNKVNATNHLKSKGSMITSNNNSQKSSHYFKCGLVQKNPSGNRKYCGGYGSMESREYFGLDTQQHQQYQSSQMQNDYLSKQVSTSVSRAQSHHDHYNSSEHTAFSRCYSGNKNNNNNNNNGNASNIHSNACAVAAIQPLNFRRLSKVIKPPARRDIIDSSDNNRDSSKKTTTQEETRVAENSGNNLNSRLKRESTKKYFFCYNNPNASKHHQSSSNAINNNPSQSQQSQQIARNTSNNNNNSSADSNILYTNSHFKVRNGQQKRRSQPSLVQVPDSFSSSKQQQQLFSYQPSHRNSSQHSQGSSSRSSLHQTVQQLQQQPSLSKANSNQLNTKKKMIYPLLQQAQSNAQSITQLSAFPYGEVAGENYESVPYLPVRQSSATQQQQQSTQQQTNISSAQHSHSKHLSNASCKQLAPNLTNGALLINNSNSKSNLQTDGNFSKSIYSCLNTNINDPPAKTVLLQPPMNQQAYASKSGITDLQTKLFGKSQSQHQINEDGKNQQPLKQCNQPQQQQIYSMLKLNTKAISSNGGTQSSRQHFLEVSPLRKRLIMPQNGVSQTEYVSSNYDDYQDQA